MILARRVDSSVHEQFMALAGPQRPARFRVLMLQLAAEFAAYAGDITTSFERIAGAMDAGFIDLVWLDHCPHLAAMRADPRFPAVRARLDAVTAPIRAVLDGA